MLNIPPKLADDGSSEKDADMAGGNSTITNPMDSDFAMSTPPKEVVITKSVLPASATKNYPKMSGVGFQSIAGC